MLDGKGRIAIINQPLATSLFDRVSGFREACDAILNDRPLKAGVVQYPRKIGEQTIEMIAKYFRGEEVPAVLPVPVGIMDKNSLQEAK